MSEYSVKLTFGYENTDETRQYEFDCRAERVGYVKDNILAINASLAASTDGGMAEFFLSDSGNRLKGIVDASIIRLEEFPIDLNSGVLSLTGGTYGVDSGDIRYGIY